MLFLRKGMDLYDLEAISRRRQKSFLGIVELVLIFKDFEQKSSPLEIFHSHKCPLNHSSLLKLSIGALPRPPSNYNQKLQVPLHLGEEGTLYSGNLSEGAVDNTSNNK